LTKKMAEDLTDYLMEYGHRVRYLHSEGRHARADPDHPRPAARRSSTWLVGVNLPARGVSNLPEVSLVAIVDADKEGFLRGATSLIQTIGAARRENVNGKVLMLRGQEVARR